MLVDEWEGETSEGEGALGVLGERPKRQTLGELEYETGSSNMGTLVQVVSFKEDNNELGSKW